MKFISLWDQQIWSC